MWTEIHLPTNVDYPSTNTDDKNLDWIHSQRSRLDVKCVGPEKHNTEAERLINLKIWDVHAEKKCIEVQSLKNLWCMDAEFQKSPRSWDAESQERKNEDKLEHGTFLRAGIEKSRT